MMTTFYGKQTAYLGSLLLMLFSCAQADAATDQWYYNQRLTSPADSRAILEPYYQSKLQQQNFTKYRVLKHWAWLKQRSLPQVSLQLPYHIPQSTRERALPFWPDLKPK